MSQPYAPEQGPYTTGPESLNNMLFDPNFPPMNSLSSLAMGGGHGDDQEIDAGMFLGPQNFSDNVQQDEAQQDPVESLRRMAAERPAPPPPLPMTPPNNPQPNLDFTHSPSTPPGLSANPRIENAPNIDSAPTRPDTLRTPSSELERSPSSRGANGFWATCDDALAEAIKKLNASGLPEPVDKDAPGKRSRVNVGRRDIAVAVRAQMRMKPHMQTYGKRNGKWRDTWKVVRSLGYFQGASLPVFQRRMEEIKHGHTDFDSAPAWLRKLGDEIYIDVGSQIENIKGEEERARNDNEAEKARRLQKQEEDEVGGNDIRRKSMRPRRKRSASSDDIFSESENEPPRKKTRHRGRSLADQVSTMNELAQQMADATTKASERYDKAVDRLITALAPRRPENGSTGA